jgi:threonyl-tRNA synthetase
MIKITLPDGSIRKYDAPLTVLDVAKDISEGLARNVISASFNAQTVDSNLMAS